MDDSISKAINFGVKVILQLEKLIGVCFRYFAQLF
jgi:hypothetical protein